HRQLFLKARRRVERCQDHEDDQEHKEYVGEWGDVNLGHRAVIASAGLRAHDGPPSLRGAVRNSLERRSARYERCLFVNWGKRCFPYYEMCGRMSGGGGSTGIEILTVSRENSRSSVQSMATR